MSQSPTPQLSPPPAPRPHTKPDLAQANSDAAAAQIAYFRSIPWCAALLASSPDFHIDQSLSRVVHPAHNPNHALISRTLNTPDAIPAYVAFYAPPAAAPGALVREVHALAALGPGVNSWAGMCHGGIVTTLVDEAVARVVDVNQRLGGLRQGALIATGQLDMRFLKPVRTGSVEEPGVVLVTGRLAKVDGRRCWVEGEVRGPDGEVLVKAQAVLFTLRAGL